MGSLSINTSTSINQRDLHPHPRQDAVVEQQRSFPQRKGACAHVALAIFTTAHWQPMKVHQHTARRHISATHTAWFDIENVTHMPQNVY